MYEEVVKYIENLILEDRDFVYQLNIDSNTYSQFNILLVNIEILFDNQNFNTQPILYGTNKNLEKLSISLWNELSNDWINKPIEDKNCYSLKNNVLIPELSKFVTPHLGKTLDIGSYNGEILYLLKKKKILYIDEYTGVDIINKSNIKLCNISTKQRYIEENINIFLKQNVYFDTIFLSMTLLNIIDIDIFFKNLNNISKKNTTIYIVDINSDAYQAKGFYFKKNNEWFLKQIFKSNQTFYTLKKLSKNYHTIHCFHPFQLYKQKLINCNFNIKHDSIKGANVNDIISLCSDTLYQKKTIKKMSKYTKYPCFHFLVAKKT